MKISIPSFLLVVAVKGNKVPALRGELTVTSDGTDGFGTLTCPIFQLQGACIRYGSHNDPQGMVCGNDGEANEAYCNYINYSTDAVACKIGRCGLTPEEVYDPQSWNELPSAIQQHYATLGYNEAFWNYNLRTPATHLGWSELSHAQQQAMVGVGYTQSSWDNSENGECAATWLNPAFQWWCENSTEAGCRQRSQCAWTPSSE